MAKKCETCFKHELYIAWSGVQVCPKCDYPDYS